MEKNKKENDRASRIAFTIEECHTLLASLYENLVDKEFVDAKKDCITIITEIKIIFKSIDQDDF
jgi:hypothetical protein